MNGYLIWAESIWTSYRYDRTSGSMLAYLPRAAAIETLRAGAKQKIRDAQRLLAALDADEVEVTWQRGWKTLPAPDETAEGQR